jgi:hypothetical protein
MPATAAKLKSGPAVAPLSIPDLEKQKKAAERVYRANPCDETLVEFERAKRALGHAETKRDQEAIEAEEAAKRARVEYVERTNLETARLQTEIQAHLLLADEFLEAALLEITDAFAKIDDAAGKLSGIGAEFDAGAFRATIVAALHGHFIEGDVFPGLKGANPSSLSKIGKAWASRREGAAHIALRKIREEEGLAA